MANLRVNFVKSATRDTQTIKFGGVDYATPKMSITDGKSIDLCNYVYRDNAVQKRYGVNAIETLESVSYYSLDMENEVIDDSASEPASLEDNVLRVNESDAPIYDIWSFGDYLIIHKGALLFYVLASEVEKGILTPIARRYVNVSNSVAQFYTYKLPERKMSAFMGNSKLWILTGVMFLVLSSVSANGCDLRPVQNDAHAPLTTIGITPTESTASSRETVSSDNLLSEWVENGLVGGYDGDMAQTFVLDRNIEPENESDMSNFYVDINTPKFPYRNIKTQVGNGNSDFAYPYMKRDSGILNLHGKNLDFEGKNIVLNNDEKTVLKPHRCSIYGNDIPALSWDDNDPNGVIIPSYDSAELAKYVEGEYYYQVLTLGSGNTSYDVVSPTVYGWSSSVLDNLQLGYWLVIYARYEGVMYYSITHVYTTLGDDTFYLPSSTRVMTDAYDYAGNLFVSAGSGANASCFSLGFLNFYDIPITGIDLNSTAGNYIESNARSVGYTVNGDDVSSHIAGTYYAEKIRLKAIKLSPTSDVITYNNGSKLELSVVGYPFGVREGYFLVMEDEVNSSTAHIYGYIGQDYLGNLLNYIVLFFHPAGSNIGESNITVHFPCYVEGNADLINHCTFGTMFGTSNTRDRLFISGNDNKPNLDWHSAENGEDEDLNFFPSDSVMSYGNDSNAVVGYNIVSDGKLMVVKKPSDKESSIYYRTATYAIMTDDQGVKMTTSGGDYLYEESYPKSMTNSHIGGVAHYLFTDFNGDAIFVSSEGKIVGMNTVEETSNNQMVATTRSKAIDRIIRKSNYKDCALIQDGNELFYGTPEYLWYTHYEDPYDWFKIGIQNVVSFTHYRSDDDDYQLFGTSDGKLMKVLPNVFSDTDTIRTSDGDISVLEGVMSCNNTIKTYVNNGYGLYFTKVYVYMAGAVDFEFGEDTETITLNEDVPIVDGNTYFIVTDNGNFESALTFEDVTDDGKKVYNVETDQHDVLLNASEVHVYRIISETAVEAEVSDENAITIKVKDDYSDTMLSYSEFFSSEDYELEDVYLVKKVPVYAYYITAPYLSAGLGYRKAIDSYTLVTDMEQPSEIFVKLATNNVSLDDIMSDEANITGSQLSFNDLDYDETDYRRYVVPHAITLGRTFYGLFISFRLYSPDAKNSTLTQLQFVYHVSKRIIGRR